MKEIKNTNIIGLLGVIIVAVFAITACLNSDNKKNQESQNNPSSGEQVPSLIPVTDTSIDEIEKIPANTVTAKPPTKTPEPPRVGIEALNVAELQRYNQLTEDLKNAIADPSTKIDQNILNKFDMYINTVYFGDGQDNVLSEDQLKASKVFEEIMYFACNYGLMPDADTLNFNHSFSYLGGVNSRLPESVAKCVMTAEILQKITESGWKVQISHFIDGADLSEYFSRGFVLDPERIDLLESGRSPRIDNDESFLLTDAQVGRLLLGVGPDKESILEFGNQMLPLATDDSRLLPKVLIMKDDFMPFGGEVGDNIWIVSFLPPDVDPKNHRSGFASAPYPESHFYYSASVITTYANLK